jgi:hypothetical protein
LRAITAEPVHRLLFDVVFSFFSESLKLTAMKTTTKILLYDDYCPLCTWYSGLFVKFHLLEPGNRVAFSKADLSVLTAIDIEKG